MSVIGIWYSLPSGSVEQSVELLCWNDGPRTKGEAPLALSRIDRIASPTRWKAGANRSVSDAGT